MTKREMLKEILNEGTFKANADRYEKELKKTAISSAYIIYTMVSHTQGKKALISYLSNNFARVRPLKTLPHYEKCMDLKRG